LHITRQVMLIGREIEVGKPKTEGGERTISLDTGSVQVLRRWRERQNAERAATHGAWQDTGLVFTREDGNQLHPEHVADTFQCIYQEAGLPPIRLHDLRHTAASLALQAGVPMKVVSEQLGHSSLGITADTYTSVLPAVAQAAAEAVAGIVPRRAPEPEQADADQTPADGRDAATFTHRSHSASQEGSEDDREASQRGKAAGQMGAPGRDRTCDHRIRSPLLYPLSYGRPAAAPGDGRPRLSVAVAPAAPVRVAEDVNRASTVMNASSNHPFGVRG
jgi:hypothetical protein